VKSGAKVGRANDGFAPLEGQSAGLGTFHRKSVSVSHMTTKWFCLGTLPLALSSLVGCQAAPQPERQRPAARTTVHAVEESSLSKSASADDNCGLTAFPVSKSAQELLAAVPRDGARPPNSMMRAKVVIDTEGRVTHLCVLRLAYPEVPNSAAISEHTIDSIKRWRYPPTTISGIPVAVCSEVGVTIDWKD
jgi:hypothetical protein